jgi:hypothetical protein
LPEFRVDGKIEANATYGTFRRMRGVTPEMKAGSLSGMPVYILISGEEVHG